MIEGISVDRSTRHHQVTDIDEFALIDSITAGLPTADFVEVGLGDDAAVVAMQQQSVVLCTDMFVEGRHFRQDWSSAEDVGHRVAAANMADVAAMGAHPKALLISIAVPEHTEAGWVADLLDGVQAEADRVGAVVVGGDTNATEGPIVVSGTAIGDLQGHAPVRRHTARPGDQVAIAGRQGWAAAGLTVLSRGFRSPRLLVDALRRPEVPYAAGPAAAAGGATAMIDVSDGLMADLGHIAQSSGVGIDISAKLLPVDDALRDTAVAFSIDPLLWVLGGGEDHSLVATFAEGAALPPGFHRIGTVTQGDPVVTVDGATRRGVAGWRHFGSTH
jgi:thiamine-monophosphate kinase